MNFSNTETLKPTGSETGRSQVSQIEKKLNDIETQISDINSRLTQTENTVEGLDTSVTTGTVNAAEVHSGHDYTTDLSVSNDANIQGELTADEITANKVTVSDTVNTKDINVSGTITAENASFYTISVETFNTDTFNADELNAVEFSSDNADITNLSADSVTSDSATLKDITSQNITTNNVTVTDKITGKDAELSGDLSADEVNADNIKVTDTADVLKLIADTMHTGRIFIAPEKMQLIPENGWIHFHNVNAGRFIVYLTDYTDITTNIHSMGNVLFSAVIDYTNNTNKGNVVMTYVQPQQKAFEKVYIAANGELWLKRSPEYLNARRCIVFAETEKELVVDTFVENAQTFDVTNAKSVNLSSFDGSAEINSEKKLKGNYTIDGNVYITGYLTPGQTITERSLFLGYSDLITGDNNGVLSAYGATITDDVTIGGTLNVTDNTTLGADLSVTGDTTLTGDLSVTGETTLNDDIAITGDVSVIGNETVTGKIKASEAEISGELKANSIEASGDIKAGGSIVSDGNLVVHGDLHVEGTTVTVNQEQVTASGDYIVTRANNSTPLANNEYSGLAVNNYDTNKMATITADHEGTWRVSNSATKTAVTYTDVSNFAGNWYSGLTDTPATVNKGIITTESADKLSNVVFYNGNYYHKNGNTWYGTLSIVSGKFDIGSVITDTATITALEALTPNVLLYYNSLTIAAIDSSTNQPLLTRAEENTLNNNDILVWDGTNKKAVNLTRPVQADNDKYLTCHVDNQNNVSYSWTNPVVYMAAIAAVTGGVSLSSGRSIKIMFTSDITGADGVTPLTLSYNGTSYAVKAVKNSAKIEVYAHELTANTFTYIQAFTTLELVFDGTDFVIIGNPIILSSSDYKIYADGSVGDEPIATLKEFYLSSAPYGYLEADGSDTTGTSKELSTHYPKLYTKLGNSNVLPDFRECSIVGIGQSTNDYNASTNPTGIQAHDVFTLGEFKDDQLQGHKHNLNCRVTGTTASLGSAMRGIDSLGSTSDPFPYVSEPKDDGTDGTPRYGIVTRGKRKGALICIKAL